MTAIEKRFKNAQEKKTAAAEASGLNAEDILLVAVTKTRTPDEINQAIDAGATDIGENKVQEIMDKYDKIKPVRWHMIGHLQTNKVKYIIDKVDLIHSVDSIRLAEEIDRHAKQHGKIMDILIQINAAGEESKFGIASDETGLLLKGILETCENIRVCGFMSIAPYADDPEVIRTYFNQVKVLYDEYFHMDHPRMNFKYLSMGMSHDYEVAIREGANLIRIGTAIFSVKEIIAR